MSAPSSGSGVIGFVGLSVIGCSLFARDPVRTRQSLSLVQRRALVRGNMVGFAALDLVLRRLGARAVGVALVVEVAGVDPDDRAADVTGFRVPPDPISHLESLRPSASLRDGGNFDRPFPSQSLRSHLQGVKTLDSLLSEVRARRACADVLPLGPRPVVQISATARILIASQVPGTKAAR